ncbi:DUF4012 domain-containing protein [Tengunoibacter tsumagoiensis]|uniref:DUF4012 domain-containing protein n=1 Tax=Tengunoibacter tsumagoiensis TaxID=2014871 RepID=A0A402A427_9CHLR|nr:DUF4012 domain-containing protein [Tengunoibacter tsumagoiensis]GCE13870.1 hypothetical protein KTT_37290 [Tengunoibacter tsumagoiensis]
MSKSEEQSAQEEQFLEAPETMNEAISSELTATPSHPDEMEDTPSLSDEIENTLSRPDEMEDVPSTPDEMEDVPSTPDEMEDVPSTPDEMEDVPSTPDEMEDVPSTPDEMEDVPSHPDETGSSASTINSMIRIENAESIDGRASQTSLTSNNDDDEDSRRLLDIYDPLNRTDKQLALSGSISPQLQQRFRRYVRRSLRRRHKGESLRGLSGIILCLLLFSILGPTVFGIGLGIQLYSTYNELRTHTNDGIQNLMELKNLFGQQNNSNLLDTQTIQRGIQNLHVAQSDFRQVQIILNQNTYIQAVPRFLPQYTPLLNTSRAGTQMGIDITEIGLQALTLGQTFAPRLHGGSFLGDNGTPLLIPQDIPQIHITLNTIAPIVKDLQQQAQLVQLDSLPISSHQREQLQSALNLVPTLASSIQTAQTWLDPLSWLLGVDHSRTLLVETMDRGELRATGGFTGQYGELTINGGRIAPLTLQNVALLEYTAGSPNQGQLAPEPYRSWWPFDNWGLRDANLSPDFPTSARLVSDQYTHDTKRSVDGVVMFTPFLIKDILKAIGPVTVPVYNETVTDQNLEEILHFYQLAHDGIMKEKEIEHVTSDEEARKQFTTRLTHVLFDQLRKTSPTLLIKLGQILLIDLQTRDLEIYATNPQLEDLLLQNGYASQVNTATKQDGLYVVQANVSASKAAEFVRTQLHDTANLATDGSAVHTLQIRLAYTQVGDVYGLDTYRDYVRVYVPPTAHFIDGTGFDDGKPLCDGPLAPCPAVSIYPHDDLICPTGLYHGGASAPILNDPYYKNWHPLDGVGAPTNFQSDLPGRAMFAGYAIVPKNCTLTLSLTWSVPALQSDGYQLLVQRQTGTYPEVDMTILPPPQSCSVFIPSGLHFNGVLEADQEFNLKRSSQAASQSQNCTVSNPV